MNFGDELHILTRHYVGDTIPILLEGGFGIAVLIACLWQRRHDRIFSWNCTIDAFAAQFCLAFQAVAALWCVFDAATGPDSPRTLATMLLVSTFGIQMRVILFGRHDEPLDTCQRAQEPSHESRGF